MCVQNIITRTQVEGDTSKIRGEKKFKYLRRDVRFKYRVKGAETRKKQASRIGG